MAAAAAGVGVVPGPPEAHEREVVDWNRRPYSRLEALRFLPAGANLRKREAGGARWEVMAPYLGSRSRVFVRGEAISDHAALRFVLQLVWSAATDRHGLQCPYVLDRV